MRDVLYRLMGNALRQPAGAVAAIVEPQSGPWKRNFNWGGGYNDAMPAAEGAELPLFSNEEIPGPPRVQSVVLSRNVQSDPGTNSDFRARVEYTTGAAVDAFLCDWNRGAQFTIVANWVRVTAVSYRPSLLTAYSRSGVSSGIAKVVISAAVAEGSVVSPAEPLTYTEPITQLATATTAFVNAPDFAKAVMLTIVDTVIPSPSNITVRMSRGAAPAFAIYTYEQMIAFPRGAALPGGTRGIVIENLSGVTMTYTVTWLLGL